MSEFHKLIKTIATLFAIALAVFIVVSIGNVVLGFTGFLSLNNKNTGTKNVVTKVINQVTSGLDEHSNRGDDKDREDNLEEGNGRYLTKREAITDVKKIKIYHINGKLVLKESDNNEFLVEAVNVGDDFKIEQEENGVLIIKENQQHINFNILKNEDKVVTVSIPKGVVIDEFYLNAGVGDVSMEDIQINEFIMDAGVGEIKGSNIVADEVRISCGLGNCDFRDVLLGKTYIEGGVGNIVVRGEIQGDIEIESGMGNVKLDLDGSIEDYNIKGEKGLGNININDEKMSNYNGSNSKYDVKVEGGIGNIDIRVK